MTSKVVLASSSFGADVLYENDKYRIEKWIDGRTLTYDDLMSRDTLVALVIPATISRRNRDDASRSESVYILRRTEDGRHELIDFEFASHDLDRAYDVANFFVEWCYDYDSIETFRPDTKRFPR